jgi:hypothetical protein
MELLKNISVIWALVHGIVMFFSMFESRFSKKKTVALAALTIGPLCIINLALFYLLGFEKYGMLMLATLSLPSCAIFWFLAKFRDGRFLFTFCMVDTVVLEILYITNILNHYLTPNSYLVMFILRLIIYPALTWWIIKRVRTMYLNVQRNISMGWVSFAVIGILMYLTIMLLMSYPAPVTERPDHLPALILVFILMPVVYLNIISTLRHMLSEHEKSQQDDILALQVSSMTVRMEELSVADQMFRMERHNFRHKMKTIASLLEAGQYQECKTLLEEYNEALGKTTTKRYCQHPVLDAVLSAYIQKAENHGIRVSYGIAFPDQIPVKEAELATAVANALENAINASEKLPADKRFIDLKILEKPQLIIKISNAYEGDVIFDEDGIPVNEHDDHGFGTRFIAAFCEKNEGFYDFQADGETFTLFINL